jgi:hypothetical protein
MNPLAPGEVLRHCQSGRGQRPDAEGTENGKSRGVVEGRGQRQGQTWVRLIGCWSHLSVLKQVKRLEQALKDEWVGLDLPVAKDLLLPQLPAYHIGRPRSWAEGPPL